MNYGIGAVSPLTELHLTLNNTHSSSTHKVDTKLPVCTRCKDFTTMTMKNNYNFIDLKDIILRILLLKDIIEITFSVLFQPINNQ